MNKVKWLNGLEYLLVVVVFGYGGMWAYERDAAEAAAARHMESVLEYRAVATCIDDALMVAGETLDDATWICELDPLTYPRID
jgi:hypothetical protein